MDTNLGQVVLVKDISPNNANGLYGNIGPNDLIEFNDKLYFLANDKETGREIWTSDGTEEGTQLLADIRPVVDGNYSGTYPFAPEGFTEFQDKLYFSANGDENNRELWVTDGTKEGTQLLADINPNDSSNPSNFIEFNDKLYFSADDGENGQELWVTDGTTENTQLAADIAPGITNYEFGAVPNSSYLNNFTAFNNKLYFAANDGENGIELWTSDGTAESTQLLVDLAPGVSNEGYAYGSQPNNFIEIDDKLFFAASPVGNAKDTSFNNTNELWVSDGTAEGTQIVADIRSGVDNYGNEYGFGPDDFVELNNKLYFTANDGDNGNELWVSDGTEDGTQLIADIAPGSASSYAFGLTEFDGKLYFSANDGENGEALWVSDGTTEGTKLLADSSSFPRYFTEFQDKLYFSANDGENGREIWSTDGTTEGTQIVTDIRPGGDEYYYFSRDPRYLTVVGNELFFSAGNSETGIELYKLTVDDLTGEPPIIINGSNGSDNLFGGDNAEQISALSGQDTVNSGGGNDTIDGGDGDDRLISPSGNNSLIGGNGNDTLGSGDGNDTLDGGNGQDVLTAGSGNDNLTGGEDNDFLDAGDGNDTLSGDNGNDRLIGGSGDDSLIGGSSNDFLDGGDGNDILEGGSGDDVFVLRVGEGTETIPDFNLAGGDRLGLADGLQFNDLTFSGQTILSGEEVLASLNGVNTEELTSRDFRAV
jgi:ELWxxDGT repeat protein